MLKGNEQLFASKYRLNLPTEEQLRAEIDYLHDNPRRLFVKRTHPEWFAIQRQLTFADNPSMQ